MQTEYIEFHGTQLVVVTDEVGQRYTAVRPICSDLGIDLQSQYTKVRSDPRFSHRDIPTTGADGKTYGMLCIPISRLNGWLFGIGINRVKPASREKLLVYQMECFDVLFRHFMPAGGTNEELLGMISSLRTDQAETRAEMVRGFQAIRGEMDELRELVHITLSDQDEKEIRALIQEVKAALGMDGRAIVGHVRATLGTSGVYNSMNLSQVKNVLRNLLGRGVLGRTQ